MKTSRLGFHLFLLTVLLISTSQLASGHLASGIDVEKQRYTLDFGYEPSPLSVDEPSQLLFTLAQNNSQVKPEHVWVRISDETIRYTGRLHPNSAGSVMMTHSFSEPGQYDVTARFHNDTAVLVEHTFKVNVQSQSYRDELIAGSLLLITVVLILIFLRLQSFI